ncbi:MAG: haloacid dehalogenase, family protein [Patescibacteria group bacterium]|jgi:HAD superfamily hydrolase (TIGR01509 family)|nr:haloacid dehalogenase, family protein [Patescibacteria group bacterium]
MNQNHPVQPPKVIFFDCWYTLFTSDLAADLKAIATRLGQEFDREFVKTFENQLMRRPYADLKEPLGLLAAHYHQEPRPRLLATLERILLTGLQRQRAYPETLAMLAELRQTHTLGLITNSFSAGFEHLQGQFNLGDYFTHIITSYETGHIKPDPAIFQAALERAGVQPHEAAMVGDSLSDDIKPARALGLTAILVDRHGRYPDITGRITNLEQLPGVLNQT